MSKGEGIYPAPTHKSMKELDAGLADISKSTRASIPAMVPAHDILRQKFSWYYDWHLNSYASKLHSIIFILYFLVVGFIATSLIAGGKLHTAKAATTECTWLGGGGGGDDVSWSDPLNWECGVVPNNSGGTTYTPIINGQTFDTINVDADITVDAIDGSQAFETLDINTGNTLSVLGDFTFSNAGIIITGDLNVGGDFLVDVSGYVNTNGTVSLNGSGDQALSLPSFTASPFVFSGSGTKTVQAPDLLDVTDLTISGVTLDLTTSVADPLAVSGTTTMTNAIVKYSGVNLSGNVNILTIPYNSLELAGAETYALTGDLTSTNALTGNLTIDAGATLDTRPVATDYDLTAVNVTVTGTLDAGSSASILTSSGSWNHSAVGAVFTAGNSTIVMTGSGTFNTGGNGVNQKVYNLQVTGAGQTITLSARTVILTGGVLTVGSASGARATIDGGQIIELYSNATPPIAFVGSYDASSGGGYKIDSTTIYFYLMGNHNLPAGNYGTLYLRGSNAVSYTATMTGAVVTSSGLIIYADTAGKTSTLDTSGNNYALTTNGLTLGISGTNTKYGILKLNDSTVSFGTSDVLIHSSDDSGDNKIIADSADITARRVWTNADANGFEAGTSSMHFLQTYATTTRIITTGGTSFYDVEFDNTADPASYKYTISGNLDVNHNLTLTDGQLDLGTNNPTVSVGGNFFISNTGTDVGVWTKSSSGITFNGTTTYTDNTTTKQNIGTTTLNGTSITLASDMTVDSMTITAGTFGAVSYTIIDYGNWSNAGTFTAGTSTVDFAKTSTTQTLNSGGVVAANIFNNVTHSGAGTLQLLTNDINIDGNFTNSAGTFDTNGKDMTVAKNWVNSATFTAGSRTVTFDSTNATVFTGSTTFNNLVMNTTTDGAKTITFPTGSGNKQIIGGTWTLNGDIGKVLTLVSATPTTAWYFQVSASFTADDYINVTDSWSANANKITAGANTTNGGNNDGWNFGNTVSGSLYSSIGGSKITDVKTIKASVNGGATAQANTSGGDYTITFSGSLSANQIVTVFVSGDSVKASTVTKVNGAGNLSGINLYQSYTTLQHETGIDQLTNADLYTAWGLGDTDMLFSVILDTTYKATFDQSVYIPATEKYVPGGDSTVLGNWNGTGTFDAGTYQVVFSASSGTQTIDTGGTGADHDFYNFSHDDASTVRLITNNLEIDSSFTQSAGTFETNNQDITIGVNWTNTGTLTTDANTTVSFNGSGSQSINGNNSFYHLDISNTALTPSENQVEVFDHMEANTVTVTDGQFKPNSGDIIYNVTIEAQGILQPVYNGTITILHNWTNNGGKFYHNSGTVTFSAGIGETQIIDTGGTGDGYKFNNFTHDGAGAINVNADHNLEVGGNWTNSDGSITSSGTVILSGTSKIISGSGANTFVNLTIQGSRSTAISISTSGNMTIDTGAVLTMSSGGGGQTYTTGGVFTMNTNSSIVGNNNTLGISSTGASTLNNITNISYLTLGASDVINWPTYTVSSDINITTLEVINAYFVVDGVGKTITTTGTMIVHTDVTAAAIAIGSNKAVTGSITITSNSFLTLGANGEIDISGTWYNTGNFNPDANSLVKFNGSSNQGIYSGGNSFANLTLENTAFITFLDPFTVSGTFDVKEGSKLQFTTGRTYSFPAISGELGKQTTLQGSGSGQWYYSTSAVTVNYLNVKNSNATSEVKCPTCTDSGNNTNWKFQPQPAPVVTGSEVVNTNTIRWHFNQSNYADGYILDNASGSQSCTSTYCDESGLSIGIEYGGRRVHAWNSLGVSSQSNEFPATTIPFDAPPAPIEKTATPSNLHATNITATSISLAWDAPTDMTDIIGYQVFNSQTGIKIAETAKSITEVTLSNLQPNTQYQFYVKSTGGPGSLSDPSNILTVQTLISDTDIIAKSAHLVLGNVPGDTTAGQSFSDPVRLTVADAGGSVLPTYTGTIYFYSSDKDAVFTYNQATPYVFSANDKGIHEFSGRDFVFNTAGQQILAVTDGTNESKVDLKVKSGNNVLNKTQAAFTSFLKGDTPVVDNTVVGTTTALLLAPATINLILGLGNLIPQLLFWLLQAMQALGIRKKRAPWGVVFNSQTGQPISLALVRVYDKEYKRLLETAVTDSAGRFGFLIGSGSFYITVTKSGFTFPSQFKLSGFYSDIYTGGTINSTKKDAKTIDLNIPLDPQTKASLSFNLSTYLIKFSGFVDNIRLPLLLIGALFAIIISLRTNNIWFFLLLGFYLIIFILELRRGKKARPYGLVTDIFEHPIETVIVRIYHKKTNRIMATDVTDSDGRFKFLVDPGVYYIVATKPGYLDYKSHIMYLEKERTLVTTNIKLRKVNK